MTEEKLHTERGQIERAQCLRRVIENLKSGQAEPPSPEGANRGARPEDRKAQKPIRRNVEPAGSCWTPWLSTLAIFHKSERPSTHGR